MRQIRVLQRVRERDRIRATKDLRFWSEDHRHTDLLDLWLLVWQERRDYDGYDAGVVCVGSTVAMSYCM
jgi:hypothetical protein